MKILIIGFAGYDEASWSQYELARQDCYKIAATLKPIPNTII